MPERPRRATRVILHPTDFSRASRAAFAKAVDLARLHGAELLVTHVMSPVMRMVGEGYMSDEVYRQIQTTSRAHGNAQLMSLVGRARKAGVRARALLLEGLPHDQIARAARARRAELIVIGTHGRSGLARLFLGSVAGRVLLTAPCPVITVRGK